MRTYFSVANYSKFQHYKDRNPPWIKLHRTVLSSYEFSRLSDVSKAHLMLIWVLASQHANKIPWDEEWLTGQLGTKEKIDLLSLQASGFIEKIDASIVLSDCKQTSTASVSVLASDSQFLEIKNIYPKREGSHRWQDAESHYHARLKDGHTHKEILDGVARYVEFCEKKGIVGSSMVQQAATFLGRNKGFEETWEIGQNAPVTRNLSAVERVELATRQRAADRQAAREDGRTLEAHDADLRPQMVERIR